MKALRILGVFIVALAGCSTALVVSDARDGKVGMGRVDYDSGGLLLTVTMGETQYSGPLDNGGPHDDHKTTKVIPFRHELEHKGVLRSAAGGILRCSVSSRLYGHKGLCTTESGQELVLDTR